MIKSFMLPCLLLLSACAHKNKCEKSSEAGSLYFENSECKVRIRQVVIGSKIALPAQLKSSDIASYKMEWVPAIAKSDEVIQGHYRLVKQKSSVDNDQDE